jgi:hypothetical protein
MGTLRFLEGCLYSSKHLTLVSTTAQFIIKEFNAGFINLVRCERSLIAGAPLKTFLHEDSWQLLSSNLAEQKMPVRFIIKPVGGGSIILKCRIHRTDDGFLIFGDQTLLAESDILRKITLMNNEMAAMTRELNRKNRQLLDAQEQIKTLTGIIPICMYCKEIRDDEGFWNQMEVFIENHSQAKFSHGICDKCMEQKIAEQSARRKQQRTKPV